jgi:hypothetical protein
MNDLKNSSRKKGTEKGLEHQRKVDVQGLYPLTVRAFLFLEVIQPFIHLLKMMLNLEVLLFGLVIDGVIQHLLLLVFDGLPVLAHLDESRLECRKDGEAEAERVERRPAVVHDDPYANDHRKAEDEWPASDKVGDPICKAVASPFFFLLLFMEIGVDLSLVFADNFGDPRHVVFVQLMLRVFFELPQEKLFRVHFFPGTAVRLLLCLQLGSLLSIIILFFTRFDRESLPEPALQILLG